MRHCGQRLLLATGLVVGVTALVLSPPPPGWAAAAMHAGLNSTKPANGSVLSASPTRIVLHFTEPVQAQTLKVLEYVPPRPEVAEVPIRIQQRGTDVVLVPVRPVDGGVTVAWSVTSDDGHVVSGAVSFWVGTPPALQRLVPLVTVPGVPASIDGATVGLRTVQFRRPVESGSVRWSHPLLPGPITTAIVGGGRLAQSSALLTLPGSWNLEATLLGSDDSIVVVRSAVTIKR